MREVPPIPEILIRPPAAPLPWQPTLRHDSLYSMESGYVYKAARSVNSGDGSQNDLIGLREYGRWLHEHYIIPGYVVKVVDGALGWARKLKYSIFTDQTRQNYDAMTLRFEQDYLGLPPNSSDTGAYHWFSNAGFSSGQYPIEPVARQVNLTPAELLAQADKFSAPVGHIMIKADDFIFAVKRNQYTEDVVNVGHIYELTPAGNEFIGIVLAAYEEGLKYP